MESKPVFIRNLDPSLYMDAKVAAIRKGVNLGDWFNDAIVLKLQQDRAKETMGRKLKE